MRTRLWNQAVVLIILLLCVSCTRRYATESNQTSPQRPNTPSTKTNVGFASREKLREHYEKHGAEFGSITMEQYLLQAQTLRDRAAGGNILQFTRTDGVTTRYDRDSGDFIAFNSDGTIRTYFKPNAGESYFLRQRDRE
jgi:pyocin large subunit-like protein